MPVPSGKRRAKPKKRTAQKKMKAKRIPKRRSAAAASLATPLYRKRVVRSAKAYSRKSKRQSGGEEGDEA